MKRCQICGKPAVVNFTQIVNHEMQNVDLCEECAAKHGLFKHNGAPLSILAALGEAMFGSFKQSLDTMSGLICPSCGCTPVIFKETGRLGCESCYAALKPLIDGVIENSQKGMSHVGKRPNASTTHCACGDACDSSAPPESQGGSAGDMDGLKVELERAVSEERYEDAAKLRDEIKKLSK